MTFLSGVSNSTTSYAQKGLAGVSKGARQVQQAFAQGATRH